MEKESGIAMSKAGYFGFEAHLKSVCHYLKFYSFVVEVLHEKGDNGKGKKGKVGKKYCLSYHDKFVPSWEKDNELYHSGFYFMVKNERVVYVGFTNRNLLARQKEHFLQMIQRKLVNSVYRRFRSL